MINLNDEIKKYQNNGLSRPLSSARVCQDVVLMAISKGALKRNVTIKGGIVMRSITNNLRRATRDMDFDFIRYPLTEEGVDSFIAKLNCIDGITITRVGDIEELHHKDYRGKRVNIKIVDTFNTKIKGKFDIGVHTNFSIEQEEYCFDVCMNKNGVSLFKNSSEQIFTEKLKSLLYWGTNSGRFKDVYDLYYLKDIVDLEKLKKDFEVLIFSDIEVYENNETDIVERLNSIFGDKEYLEKLEKAEQRWLDDDINVITKELIEFIERVSCKKSNFMDSQ